MIIVLEVNYVLINFHVVLKRIKLQVIVIVVEQDIGDQHVKNVLDLTEYIVKQFVAVEEHVQLNMQVIHLLI